MEGRIDRSRRLLGDSWRYLRGEPRLFALPAIAMLATTLAAIAIFVPALLLIDASPKITALLAGALAAFPLTFISTFCNVGFLAMVVAHQRGEKPSVGDGLRAARGRIGPILTWSLLAAGVGVVLDALARIPGVEAVGGVARWLGGLAWGLATFFVVPVLAVEGTGAIDSVRRSATTFRRRWGETVVGDLAIAVIFGFLAIPGVLLAIGGFITIDEGAPATGAILVAVAVVLLAPVLTAQSALTQLFTLSLYRHTTEGAVTGPYDERDLRAGFETPQRAWWRR